ncbi:reverse transcriptase domain-containing protein [Tanacetum coccineum]
MSTSTTSNSKPLMLDQLELGVTGTIVVMICRMWDVNSATGRYLSSDFIVSDEKLNKDDFRVLRFAHFIVEMDGNTNVRKSSVRPDGFARYPFQLVKFGSLEPTNNKYLIDVVGCVTNVGMTTTTRSGSKTLDLYLANNRLGEMLIEKRTRHVGLYPIVLTAMSVKLYNNRLYLFSTSSTMIVDDKQILVLKQFKSDDSTGAKAETLENLLMWARNRKYDAATFHCGVRIDKIRTKRGWNYPSCGGEKCKKGNLDRKHGRFWCDSCHSSVDYLVLRYRLEMEVSDDIAQAVVVMFDETARTVETGLPSALANIVGTVHTLELKSNSYYEHANYESFTYWSVVLDEALDESRSSRTLAAAGGPKTDMFVPLTTTPSVTTLSKPGEQKKPRRSATIPIERNHLWQIVRQKGAMWAVHLKRGKGEGWCWIARNEYHKFGQYGSAIKEVARVSTTAKFNVVRVLNK